MLMAGEPKERTRDFTSNFLYNWKNKLGVNKSYMYRLKE